MNCQRKNQVEAHISTELDLQKELEDRLRYEKNPQEQGKLNSQINESKNRRNGYEQELEHSLKKAMINITFRELEIVTKSILCMPPLPPETNFKIIPPQQKILKNELTLQIHHRLMMGIIPATNVRKFIENFVKINPDFPEKLKSGFVREYQKLREQGFKGDQLFHKLHQFSSGFNEDFDLQAAGLAVLCYFFEKCEIFEK
ncbi:hypothetical protein [Spirulina sp. 06S082]|uniref:hypothetical protein n=1 Tax=Spirulina sp. 06S082 TaxID=3110248 RepID=UPI002B210E09|nr:hypothetical protein [Spirulina sp. 06S082]MEA5470355.1 hypothetical protein [Spirulina sp. 06S082]